MHSWPMMVESMSATNNLRQRGAAGWTTTSTPVERAQRPARGLRDRRRNAGRRRRPRRSSARNAAAGSSSRSRPSARSTSLSSSRPAAISVAMAIRSRPPLALIAGPTASGKSALALALAERPAESSSTPTARSSIATCRSSARRRATSDRSRAEHRLYGVSDGADACSAADWAALARAEIADDPRQRPSCRSWSAGPACICARCSTASRRCRRSTPRSARRCARRRSRTIARGSNELDPDSCGAAQPGRHDRGSRARSKSCCRPAGRSADWQAAARGRDRRTQSTLRPLILLPPRDWLYARCDARFAAMVEAWRGRRGRGAARPRPRPVAAGHARDRGARDRALIWQAKRPSTRRSRAGQQATPQLRQAPIYLVRAPAAGRLAALSPSRLTTQRHARRAGTARAQSA